MEKKLKEKVVIMGGGLAGLAAGYELVKAGKKVIVVEKWGQIGGLARTIEINGFRFDTGPHRWYTKSKMVNRWMLNILGTDVVQVPRLTRIYFDKKFFFYPIRLMNALLGIGPWKALMAILDYLSARIKVRLFKPNLITMEDGYISQFGKTLYEIFFKRYSEKLWGQECTKISIDWVGQRTRGLNILTIIKDALIKNKNIVSLTDEFSYPKKGIGILSEKLAKVIKRHGGKIYTNSEILTINHNEDKITSITAKRNGQKFVIDGEYFISSIPLNDLVKRLQPKADRKINHLSQKLKYRDELLVALFINKSHITSDTWIYVHPKEIPFMRVMEMDNWHDQLSPSKTTTLVFEIACNEGDDMWQKDDKEVLDLVADSYIREFGFISRDNIIGGYVHRVTKEYPVYHLGYKECVESIKKYFKKFANLQLVGRNGTFKYNNMDHSIEMGLYAAWNIKEGSDKYDIDSVNIEREYLEEKRIENVEDELLDKPARTQSK
jgi:protoporphyrinogen oxidase